MKFPCSLETNYQKRTENREQRTSTRYNQTCTNPHKLNIPVRIIENRSINRKMTYACSRNTLTTTAMQQRQQQQQ